MNNYGSNNQGGETTKIIKLWGKGLFILSNTDFLADTAERLKSCVRKENTGVNGMLKENRL